MALKTNGSRFLLRTEVHMVGSEIILCTVCSDISILTIDSPVVLAAEIATFIDAHLEHVDFGVELRLNRA